MEAAVWYANVVTPALLRHARTTYGAAMRAALAQAGYDDVPRNGMYVIGGMALGAGGVPLGQFFLKTAYRRNVAGIRPAPVPFPWGIRKT